MNTFCCGKESTPGLNRTSEVSSHGSGEPGESCEVFIYFFRVLLLKHLLKGCADPLLGKGILNPRSFEQHVNMGFFFQECTEEVMF